VCNATLERASFCINQLFVGSSVDNKLSLHGNAVRYCNIVS
jgi:hypothetical protein